MLAHAAVLQTLPCPRAPWSTGSTDTPHDNYVIAKLNQKLKKGFYYSFFGNKVYLCSIFPHDDDHHHLLNYITPLDPKIIDHEDIEGSELMIIRETGH